MSNPPANIPPFSCELVMLPDRAVVRAAGEVDVDTIALVDARLRQAVEDGAERLILDLRAVDFLDSAGLRTILRWDADARRDGFSFALVRPSGAVERLLRLTRTEERLSIVEPDQV